MKIEVETVIYITGEGVVHLGLKYGGNVYKLEQDNSDDAKGATITTLESLRATEGLRYCENERAALEALLDHGLE